ncbi:MAG: pyrroline-5-carboxylate reductase [Candidatus Deianiraeaceae bacterium]|jgi:pyrroline-5-carboxylate reductase
MSILVVSLSKISRAFLKNLQYNDVVDIFSPNSTISGLNCCNVYSQLKLQYKYVFLGCKPQHLEDVAENLPKHLYSDKTIFISVLAGTSTSRIANFFAVQKVFRVMPSLAFEFGNSYIAGYGCNLTENENDNVIKMFTPNTIIKCVLEEQIDEFTAMYGSGMGFVFEIMNAFLSASDGMMTKHDKHDIVLNLFENAVQYLKVTGIKFSDAADNVASKGGTTEAGLRQLVKNDELINVFRRTMQASVQRAKELR